MLSPHETDILTIGFARRFATYKRATLLFSDPERLARLLKDSQRPVLRECQLQPS
jgi:starch phosphorylase